jgi:hypothetical protein
MLDLRSLVVLLLPPRFLLNSQIHHISSSPIFILQIARQHQQHLLFMFHCFKSLRTLSTSFSNMVYPLPVSRFDVTKILVERKLVSAPITAKISHFLNSRRICQQGRPFLINVLISGALELQIGRDQIHWKGNISGYIFYFVFPILTTHVFLLIT